MVSSPSYSRLAKISTGRWSIQLSLSLRCFPLLLVFHFAEEIAVGWWHGKSFTDSIPQLGGGGVKGTFVIGIILFVALIPFFFYRELCRVLGGANMYALLFNPASMPDYDVAVALIDSGSNDRYWHPLRQILQRKRMSAFKVIAEIAA